MNEVDTTVNVDANAAPDHPSPISREDLIKKVEAEMTAAKPESAEGAEAEAVEEPKPKDAKEAEDKPEDLETKVFMRAKRERQKSRDEVEARASALAQKEAEFEKRMQEYQAKEAQLKPWLENIPKFKDSPLSALKALGVDAKNTEEIIGNLLNEGKPDPIRDSMRAMQQQNATLEQRLMQMQQYIEAQEQKRAEAEQGEVVSRFVKTATDPEKYPTLAAAYGDDHDDLIFRANHLCEQYKQKSGEYPPWDDVLEYLEEKEKLKYSRVANPQKVGGAQGKQPAPGGKGNGHRAIGAGVASQKASAPVPFTEMRPEQQREFLKEVAARAMEAARGAGNT